MVGSSIGHREFEKADLKIFCCKEKKSQQDTLDKLGASQGTNQKCPLGIYSRRFRCLLL